MKKHWNSRRRIDLTGQRFTRLVVIKQAGTRNGRVLWKCKCDCGCVADIQSTSLRSGHTKSCGCLNAESRLRPKNIKHGEAAGRKPSATYRIWIEMHRRCKDPKRRIFALYGGRGIAVCERWQKFENFLFDMGERPPHMSIDRIDNNGNYEPGNCRWATVEQQQNNRRSNRTVTAFGRTMTHAQWAREIGADRHIVSGRLRRGWTPERAVSTPPDLRRHPAKTQRA